MGEADGAHRYHAVPHACLEVGKLEPAAYRTAFQRDVVALATAARQDLSAAVPSCPGRTVASLVAHRGWLLRTELGAGAHPQLGLAYGCRGRLP